MVPAVPHAQSGFGKVGQEANGKWRLIKINSDEQRNWRKSFRL
jgi:hypothetical protein